MVEKSKLSRNSIALIAFVALAGCAAGPNYKTPAGPAQKTFAMEGDRGGLALAAPAAGAWWRAFGSAKLDAVMDEALANNHELALANATLAEARADEDAARGGQAPTIDANAGAVRERINTTAFGFTGFPSPTITLYSIGGAVNYDLDIFGGKRRRAEAAGARAQAAARRAEAAYLTLTGRVARQAFLIASLRAQIEASEAVIAEDESNLDLIRRAEAAGGSARVTTESSASQLASDKAALPPLQRQLAAARHGLALLVGRAPADWAAPDFELADFAAPAAAPGVLPSELVHRRPDIMAAESDLHATTADIGIAAAALYPRLSLGATLTQSALETSALFSGASSGWVVGPSLTAPLFHGGELRAQKRAAEARAEAALARYKQTVLEAFVQVADVMEALARDDDEVNARVSAEQTAAKRLDTAQRGFQRGGLAYLDVLDAQRRHNEARQALAEARGRRLADFALLYVAVGADWRDAGAAAGP
jgi:NodT family efflux transporter outer membrane factor (OMF) lipoprotein